MRPSIPPSGLYDENEVASNMETSSIHQLWRQNGWCPENTIPIKRTKKDDVLRASSVERYGKKSHRTIPNPISSYMQEIVQGHEVYSFENIWKGLALEQSVSYFSISFLCSFVFLIGVCWWVFLSSMLLFMHKEVSTMGQRQS